MQAAIKRFAINTDTEDKDEDMDYERGFELVFVNDNTKCNTVILSNKADKPIEIDVAFTKLIKE